ncbi:glycosyltransferase family 4 protein [Longibacter sp.]|uniref:glycosyltransferase family 4 protein n=1 Tax=Longibacter sp. TaxID=2045415 RepID=UPI003EBD4E6A
MHVAHFAPSIWRRGGIASYIRRLGAAQTARGDTVTHLSLDPDDRGAPDTYVLDTDAAISSLARQLDVDLVHLHKSVSVLPAIPTVRTMHGHQGSCPSGSRFLARTASPCHRTPGAVTCLWGKSVDRCGSIRPSRVVADFERLRREVEQADQIPTMTVSRFIRQKMQEAGCNPRHLFVVASPAPTVERVEPLSPDAARFLFLGRFVPEKGVMWLLRSYAEMESTAHLDLAGEGPLLPDVRAFIRHRNLDDRVTLHGWVDDDAVAALMRSARAVVFPSVWHEPAGLVSLEAAAHARPLIASRTGGIPEYARPEYAIRISPNDQSALTAALDDLASDPDRARKMGEAGRTLALGAFGMDRFLTRIDAVYRRALQSDVGIPAPLET